MRPGAILLVAVTLHACARSNTTPSSRPAASDEATPPAREELASPAEIAAHIAALEHATGASVEPLDRGAPGELMRIGEPAVPALIDCFENDTRRTEISDDNWRQPGYLDVSTLCLRLVEAILDEPDLAYREGAIDRRAAAAALRAYVDRYGAMAPVARRVAMLTDPSTTDRVAAIAARWLTTRTGELDAPHAIDYVGTRRRVGPMRGTSLRSDASVDLVGAMVPRATRAMDAGHAHDACELAAATIEWDASAEPRLLPIGRSCLAAACPCSYAFVALVGHADAQAAVDFLEDHGTTLLASDSFSRARGVEIAKALDIPAVRRVVEARLAAMDVESALHEAVREPPPQGLVVLLLAWSRAGLPSARAALDRALADATVLGSIRPDPGADGSRVHLRAAWYTLRLPEPITRTESLRAADLVANALALELGVPFSLGWPLERRDPAIATLRARITAP